MYDVDDDLAVLLQGRHTPVARLLALDPDGAVRQTFDANSRLVLDASVDTDRTRDVRRACRLTIANVDGYFTPHEPGDLFFPGEWIALERGALLDGEAQYVRMFTGPITSARPDMNGTLGLTAEDPMSLLRQQFGEPDSLAAGTSAEDAMIRICDPVLTIPSTDWLMDAGGRTIADTVIDEDQERLGTLVAMMAAMGLEVFADRYGVPVLQAKPDPTVEATGAIVRAFRQEPGVAAMTDMARETTDLPINRVIVVVERPDGTVLRAVADVTDTDSSIHSDRIGLQVAPILHSALVSDQASANAVARNLLIEYTLNQDTVSGSAIPDITLDEGDVVSFDETVTGTDARYRLERVTYPIVGGEDMTLDATRVLPIFLLAT
jgi:hypothetical protein